MIKLLVMIHTRARRFRPGYGRTSIAQEPEEVPLVETVVDQFKLGLSLAGRFQFLVCRFVFLRNST